MQRISSLGLQRRRFSALDSVGKRWRLTHEQVRKRSETWSVMRDESICKNLRSGSGDVSCFLKGGTWSPSFFFKCGNKCGLILKFQPTFPFWNSKKFLSGLEYFLFLSRSNTCSTLFCLMRSIPLSFRTADCRLHGWWCSRWNQCNSSSL